MDPTNNLRSALPDPELGIINTAAPRRPESIILTQENTVIDIEKQIQDRLAEQNADFEGAQDLIDAHIDEVTGGAFSLHINFTKKQ
jgi:hypothetical protein